MQVATYRPALDVAGNVHPRTAAEARFSLFYVVATGLRFGRVSYDDFDMSGTTVSTADTDTLAAEARLQVSRSLVSDGLTVTPFAIVALGNAISTGGDVTVDNIGLVDALEGDGLYGKLSAGVEVGSADGRLQGFARAESTLSEDALWGAVKVGGSVGF